MRIFIQFSLCVFVSTFNGGILLLDVPLKWKIALLGAMGSAVLTLMLPNPRRILLILLAFTVPIVFSKALIISSEHFSLTKAISINLSDVLVLILLLLYLAELARHRTEMQFHSSIRAPAVLWLILSSLSLLTARDIQLAVFQLINMFKLLLLYWIVSSSIRNDVDVTFVVAGLVLGMLFQALVGIYQGATGHPVGLSFLTENAIVFQQYLDDRLVNRVQGTMGHPNSYAMYITTVIPFVLALLFCKIKISLKVLAAVILCLGTLALIYSLSRSAWINFLVIVSIIFMFAVRRKLLSLGAAVLVIGTTCLILTGLTLFGPDIIIDRLTSDDQGSAYGRITLAQTALAIIKDHPWVGVGINNYMLVSPQYDARAYSPQIAFVVHNAFLLIAAETGLVGLIAFLVFLATLLIQTWRTINWAPNDTVWVAGAGLFSAFIALALHSMTDYALLGSSQVFTQFWLLAGLVAAIFQRSDYEQRHTRDTCAHSRK